MKKNKNYGQELSKAFLSIGYNRKGQHFFDYVNSIRENIHSVYFNPLFMFGHIYDFHKELKKFKELETYNIPLNIMFNWGYLYTQRSYEDTLFMLEKFMGLNKHIDALTVLDQKSIDVYKREFPQLKIHISTMININSFEELKEKFNLQDIYCVNVNSDNIFNLKFIKKLHAAGIKVKIIANQSCIWKHNLWANYYFNQDTCGEGVLHCGHGCYVLFEGKNEWLNLTRQTITKEFLPYYQGLVDIVKISSRSMTMQELREALAPWLSKRRSWTFDNIIFKSGIPEEFVEKRMFCDHKCKACLFCKTIFEQHFRGLIPQQLPVTGIRR